jgi:hypothetical protein
METKLWVDVHGTPIMVNVTISQPTHKTTTLGQDLESLCRIFDIRTSFAVTVSVDISHDILLHSRHIRLVRKHIQLKQHPIPLLFRKFAGIQPCHKRLCLSTAQPKIDTVASDFGKRAVYEDVVVA